MTTQILEEPTFGIGAVARMTGIPMDTLRVWERRYNTVTPRRSPENRRYYTREDVARLVLIKQLVDGGHAIGSVAQLPDEALRNRLQTHADMKGDIPTRSVESEQKIRVLVYGDFLAFSLDNESAEMFPLEIVGRHSVYSDFERDVLEQRPEVLVAEFPALWPDAANRLRDLAQRAGAKRALVVYGFASKPALERLARQGVLALRAPVTPVELADACLAAARRGQPATIEPALALLDQESVPPRRFDGESLAAITRCAPKVLCECPKHLVDLVTRLGAFEDYSVDCENRNDEDALLHAHLHRVTGQARALLEEALERWLEIEGIDLEAEKRCG